MVSEPTPKLTVGIATRNRPISLRRCITSLALIDDLVTEIIVVDDTSDAPVTDALHGLPRSLAGKLRVVEQKGGKGPIAARNTMMRLATNDYVLSMDDDAYVIHADGLRRALELLASNAGVAAVACAQAEADGSPWPAAMQPSPAPYCCHVTAYIGFAHLVRRQVFLDLGGYQESFYFYGEEKDFCLRALNAGFHVVYMPDVLVAHVPDPSGRSQARYIRYVIRNDCLSALFNEPLPLPLATVPLRLARYFVMRRRGGVTDPGGLWWLIRELADAWPTIWRERRPMRWSSLRRWRELRRVWPAFAPDMLPRSS